MAALVPAVRAVEHRRRRGPRRSDRRQVSAHGSRAGDGVSMIDGMRIGNMYISSNLTNMSLSPLLFDEVNVQLSGQLAETGTNGVIMNAIPRSGGNRFSGSFLANGSGPELQGSNLTDEPQGARRADGRRRRSRRCTTSTGRSAVRSSRTSCGSTRRRATSRTSTSSRRASTPTDVTAIDRTNDLSRQGFAGTYTYDNNGRVTWAISEKQKISSWYAYQYKVDPHWLLQIFNASPEAARITTWHTQLSTTKWTYAATNKLLFEVGSDGGREPRHDQARIPIWSASAAELTLHLDYGADGGQLLLPRADGLRLRRSPAVAVVHRLDELRHRLAQRQGRLRHAARPLLARRQQRLHRRHLVHHHGRRAGLRDHSGAGVTGGRTISTTTWASTRRIDGR